MSGMTIKITGDKAMVRRLDSLGKVARGKTLERALVAGALIVQNAAKERAPYVTGNLRRSIHIGGHEDLNPDGLGDIVDRSGTRVPRPEVGPHKVTVYVGTDVNYAAAVEYGSDDGKRRGKPYLRPAMDENKRAVQEEVAAALRDLIDAAVR
jgi:HK97 gp10 family phage protein